MKTTFILFALAIALTVGATDIVPNPAAPGNIGQSTNAFPNVYGTNVHAQTLTFGDGSTQTTAATAAAASYVTNFAFVDGKIYTNTSTAPIGVGVDVSLYIYSGGGNPMACEQLRIIGVTTNSVALDQGSIIFNGADRASFHLEGFVPANAAYCFTNASVFNPNDGNFSNATNGIFGGQILFLGR